MELDQACVSKRSIARAGTQGIIYASPDGLVMVGPRGGEVITRDLYSLEEWRALGPENIVAFYHDNQYVAFLADRALSFAPDNGGIVEFDQIVRAGYQDREDDRLFVIHANQIKEWRTAAEGSEALKSMLWRSRLEPGPDRSFSAAQVISEATTQSPITFKLFADGTEVLFREVSSDRSFRLPPISRAGEWQYEVSGAAEVKEVRIGALREMIGGRATRQPATPRIQVSSTLTVDEGDTATIRARLTAEPTGDVTITATEASADISIAPATRTFTMAQLERLSGVDGHRRSGRRHER